MIGIALVSLLIFWLSLLITILSKSKTAKIYLDESGKFNDIFKTGIVLSLLYLFVVSYSKQAIILLDEGEIVHIRKDYWGFREKKSEIRWNQKIGAWEYARYSSEGKGKWYELSDDGEFFERWIYCKYYDCSSSNEDY